MLSLQWIRQKMGLATYIVQQTSEFVSHLDIHAYYPMDMTHTGDPIHNTRCRINALSHCDSQSGERALCDKRHTDNVAGQWAHVSPPPPLQAQPLRDIQGSKVPGWVFRRVCHTLSATSGWSTPHGWLTACHIQWDNPATRLIHSSSPHVLTSWDECSPVLPLPSPLPDPLRHLWVWAPASEVPTVQRHFPQMSTVGWFSTSQPIHLMTSPRALDACDSIQIHRLHLLLSHEGSSLLTHQPPPQSTNVLRALCIQMSRALSDKNLGRWAALHQLRVSYLPYNTHAALRMARRLSHVHVWYTNVTPPQYAVYLVFHIYLHLVYVGVTSKALTVRLRKHQTDASSFQDCSTLHRLMLQTDSAHWGIIPLQFMNDEWYASVRERHWWFVFKKWACNDVAPGISTEG